MCGVMTTNTHEYAASVDLCFSLPNHDQPYMIPGEDVAHYREHSCCQTVNKRYASDVPRQIGCRT